MKGEVYRIEKIFTLNTSSSWLPDWSALLMTSIALAMLEQPWMHSSMIHKIVKISQATRCLTGSNGKLRIHISKLFFQPKWFVLHLSHAQVLKICKWIKVVVLKLGIARLFLKTDNQVDQLTNHFLSTRIYEFMQKKIF